MNCLLNIDLGELPGEPDELYHLADIANIACGGHAGDAASMTRALSLCARSRARPGAHPSYPDLQHFGRVRQDLAPDRLRMSVAEQCEALAFHAARAGMQLEYVKAHGALYHAADTDALVAAAVLEGALDALGAGFCVIGPAQGELEAAARALGLDYAREAFADRGRRADGSLLPRSEPGALIDDPHTAQTQALELARLGRFDTVCVHGDTPNAVAIARAVRSALDKLASSYAE